MAIRQKDYLITRMHGKIFSFLMQDGKAIEIHCDKEGERKLLGNLYIGRIQNIAKNIGAAFVRISPEMVCYLPLSDMKVPIYTKKGSSPLPQAGDELLIQVSREALKSKAPSVTTNLMFRGKYVILTTGNLQLSSSAKLPRGEKQRLSELARSCLEELGEEAASCGWLLRTNAAGIPREPLLADMRRMLGQFRKIREKAPYCSCFSCLGKGAEPYLERLTNLYGSEAERIRTDDPELYRQIQAFLSENQPEDLGKLSLYEDELLPMQNCYSLERQLAQALEERVWLKSGAYLVIQPTEALTAVDVNTGKCETGKRREETFLRINREAAAETARQIRLRNLSGIILVDFINLESEEDTKELLAFLEEELRKDPVRTVLVDVTKLYLVEITRQKRERPLADLIQL